MLPERSSMSTRFGPSILLATLTGLAPELAGAERTCHVLGAEAAPVLTLTSDVESGASAAR
jgi:hypothetical protein